MDIVRLTCLVAFGPRREVYDVCCATAGVDCYMPANGETTTVTTNPKVPVDMSLNLLKREMALGGESYYINRRCSVVVFFYFNLEALIHLILC